ncbi:MAG TPA: ATP-dependent DNA helicase RecG [Candidatus Limnocylindrales bacterium]|nr:ATP-dependent DNA helicase RecG [Candidatus Limnocylindrales bacterium]
MVATRSLDQPVTTLAGISSAYQARLRRLGVETVRDLLLLYPRRHKDLSQVTAIAAVQPGEETTVRGRITVVTAGQTSRKHMKLTKASLIDDSKRVLQLVWFNQPWVAKRLHVGDEVYVAGEVEWAGGLVMRNPDYEPASQAPMHAARIVPIYPQTEGLTSRWLRPKIEAILPLAAQLEEFLPEEIRARRRLPDRAEAVREVHFPRSAAALEAARHRLAFEEMFLLQLGAQREKRARQEQAAQPIPFDQPAARAFVAALPFRLTNAQRRAAWEILQDMARPVPMNRLLEGDVGSGKTVVATMAMHHAAQAGFQSVLLAPTEILARQHADVVESILRPFQIPVGLLLGSTPHTQRAPMLAALKAGSLAIVVGTHALIEEGVEFQRLALTIVDEQQRFGVAQRAALRDKSRRVPHFLSMTATPIPRTLAKTAFADLDISVIDEMPLGRKPVNTRLVPPQERRQAYEFVRAEVSAGRQVFVVCPLIQESDKLGVRSATQELEKLQREVFPDLASRIALLHGRLKTAEKEAVMERFQRGELAILVATSVVEVGVDIPNASVMMVEDAERFGLAQLHQFRGRVGRGVHESTCLLFTEAEDPQARERLMALVKHQSGFDLAEVDLRLRGFGDLYGTLQHGREFSVETLLDAALIKDAQDEVARLLDRDPALKGEPALRRHLAGRRVFALD